MQWLLKKILGTKIERDRKRMIPIVAQINAQEEEYQKLSEAELKAKTDEFKQRLADGETLDDILVEAFAAVKNACRRCVGDVYTVVEHEREWVEIPYDVQLIGGIALHQGKIAEMATGEGKTLVACAPVYLNALAGKGVHVVTVNDYLARRDAMWMGHIYQYLGLSVGCIQHGHAPDEKKVEYNCDITYGTNSEFGFDYLRDNMCYAPENKVHRGYSYAIIDEIDSILIDEAKTPLIISGAAPNVNIEQYPRLKPKVEALYRRQKKIMDECLQEAQKLFEAGEDDEASLRMYQIQQGMPRNPGYLRMIEDAQARRLAEKVSNNMLTDMYKEQARELREELFFVIDEKGHDASLTDKGCEAMSPDDPELYVLPDITTMFSDLAGKEASLGPEELQAERQQIQERYARRSEDIHAINQLIRAFCLYERDVEYMVQDNQVIIVDTNTGRAMPGRRWSDGLHQAVEAKEGVKVEQETQTMATVTIQNYFRMYEKLAGMTGTAETEAEEFKEVYGLDVMVIPTNRPVRRVDYNDPIYRTKREKYNALMDEIAECHTRGQPVLVGTATVEASEEISRMLDRKKIPHNVLNAKFHQAEAEVVARAGQPGAITIATNMAGRGTDIKLGTGVVQLPRNVIDSQISLGDPYQNYKTLRDALIEKPCGLHVIGTDRHESRRIDRQLRGRCSRQGDPGSSRFYVSLEDNLMRLFGSDKMSRIMERLGLEEGDVMEHGMLNKSIERAQKRVEQFHFSRRKQTLEYDDVMNKQREIVYGLRSEVLTSEDVRPKLLELIEEAIVGQADAAYADQENLQNEEEDRDMLGVDDFLAWVNVSFPIGLTPDDLAGAEDADAATDIVFERVKQAYELKQAAEDPEHFKVLERHVVLQSIDLHWQEYLRAMDHLREGIHLESFGQRNPLVEYKRQAFYMFRDLLDKINQEVASRAFRFTTSVDAMERFMARMARGTEKHEEAGSAYDGAPPPQAGGAPNRPGGNVDKAIEAARKPVRRDTPKVGRNEPCPCGSGKKYKKCHGIND